MTREEKINQIEEHTDKWSKLFSEVLSDKLDTLSSQPLDKKTAIVCTAFIIDAIKDLHGSMSHIAEVVNPDEKDLRHLGPGEPFGSEKFSEAPRPWIAEITAEVVCTGEMDDDFLDVYCTAGNLYNATGDLERLNDRQLDHVFSQIEKTPFPKAE